MSLGNGIGYNTKNGSATSGTVTSVGLTAPSIFSVGGSPVTVSGTLSLTLANQTANQVFAAPNGSAGAPSFRALVAADIPALPYGVGTVTSVGLTAPSIFSIGGSPVTASGTLSLTLASQTANHVFAAPNGSAGVPTFRALVAADFPGGAGWGLTGNGGTVAGVNFIGTTDNIDVVFKRNNSESGRIYDSSVSFGRALTSSDNLNVMFGFNSATFGVRSIMIGTNLSTAGATDRAINIGNDNGTNVSRSLAIGWDIVVDHANSGLISLISGATTSDAANELKFVAGKYRFNTTNSISLVKMGITANRALEVIGNATAINIYSTSTVPTLTFGAGAGTGAVFALDGSNQAGVMSITTGTGCTNFSDFFTLTFSGSFSYPNSAVMVLLPVNTNAQTFINDHTINSSPTFAKAKSGVVAPLDSTLYQFLYFIYGY